MRRKCRVDSSECRAISSRRQGDEFPKDPLARAIPPFQKRTHFYPRTLSFSNASVPYLNPIDIVLQWGVICVMDLRVKHDLVNLNVIKGTVPKHLQIVFLLAPLTLTQTVEQKERILLFKNLIYLTSFNQRSRKIWGSSQKKTWNIIEELLHKHGFVLSSLPAPKTNYVLVMRAGNLIIATGQVSVTKWHEYKEKLSNYISL